MNGKKKDVDVSGHSDSENKMSPKQIENFRRVLVGMIGPFALLMPTEEIQRYKDSLQHQIDRMSA